MESEKKRKRRGQVIPRSEGVFLIRVPLSRDPVTGKRTYHNETFYGTRPKAEKRCLSVLASVDDGTYFRPSGMTVNELLDRWLKHKGVRPVTREGYERRARLYIRPALGPVPLARLTPSAVQDAMDALKAKGLAPLTVRSARDVLKDMLKYAVRLKLIGENPVEFVEIAKAARRPVRAMTEDEAARFLAEARKTALPFVLWLFTGLRPAEFIGLRWADVELAGEGERAYGVLRVNQTVVRTKGKGWAFYEPKTEAGRRPVYFPAWLYYDLLDHRARQERHKVEFGGGYHDHGLVFPARNGSPVFRQDLSARMLKPLLERAGLSTEFSPYTLRRTFASLLRRANVSAREVSEQMGHTSAEFTERVYVTVYDSAKREMSDMLERLLVIGSGTQVAHNETDKLM
jgi:integrase